MQIADGLEIAEFVRRRDAVMKSLGDAAAVVFAGEGAPPLNGQWTPDWNFYYLTGIRDEPGAAVFFDPESEDPKRRCVLLLRPLNPEMEEWDGYRDRLSAELKARTGFDAVLRTNWTARLLTIAARKRRKLACLHPFAVYDAPVSPDLAAFRRVAERTIGVTILDMTDLLPSMRAVKSKAELAMMRAAADATAKGYDAVLRTLRPGIGEQAVQQTLERAFLDAGGVATAYNSIVGSGVNGTVLHYHANNADCKAGDLLVIDAAARVGGYCCDVTRTLPVSGRFTDEQAEVYSLVLRAMDAAIKAARPGTLMTAVDAAAREVIDKAGYADRFMHGIGHQLGIEVHDVTPDGPLKAGMVVTIEPGVYLPARGFGVRIEDDILITPRGSENLTAMIPKQIKDIEKAMAAGGPRQHKL